MGLWSLLKWLLGDTFIWYLQFSGWKLLQVVFPTLSQVDLCSPLIFHERASTTHRFPILLQQKKRDENQLECDWKLGIIGFFLMHSSLFVLFTLHFRIPFCSAHTILQYFFFATVQSSDILLSGQWSEIRRKKTFLFLSFAFYMALDWPRLEWIGSLFLLLLHCGFIPFIFVGGKKFKRGFFSNFHFLKALCCCWLAVGWVLNEYVLSIMMRTPLGLTDSQSHPLAMTRCRTECTESCHLAGDTLAFTAELWLFARAAWTSSLVDGLIVLVTINLIFTIAAAAVVRCCVVIVSLVRRNESFQVTLHCDSIANFEKFIVWILPTCFCRLYHFEVEAVSYHRNNKGEMKKETLYEIHEEEDKLGIEKFSYSTQRKRSPLW